MKLKYLEEINSTNSYCKNNILNLEDRTIVYTFFQTSGRGRFARQWVNLGKDNLYLSIVLKPSSVLMPVYSNLTQYTSLILAQTFMESGVSPKIKWPNDILIDSKKISGILAETVFKNGELNGIIIGVGINLNADAKDFLQIDKPVTSLNLELNKAVDKIEFFERFINKFFDSYDLFLKEGFMFIKPKYEQFIDFLGKEITINNLDEKVVGIAKEITNDGAIVINDKKFFTGDIL